MLFKVLSRPPLAFDSFFTGAAEEGRAAAEGFVFLSKEKFQILEFVTHNIDMPTHFCLLCLLSSSTIESEFLGQL